MDTPKQLIAFCHFKGGVGTSFLASNVALELANSNFLTCLVDFDTKLPNCANILGMEVKKKNSMYKYYSNNNPDLRGDYFVCDKKLSPKLYIMSSSNEDDVEILEDINDNGTDISDLYEVAKDAFDIVIVDLPLDYQNPQVIGTLEKADKIVVVGDLDINTIENTFRCLQMYKSINIQLSKFIYIPNRFFQNSDVTLSTIQDTLGIRVGPAIPLDYKAVFDSIIKSKPIVSVRHKVSDSIREICKLITGNIVFTGPATGEEEVKVAKEEVAPVKLTFVYDEEGEKSDGSSKG